MSGFQDADLRSLEERGIGVDEARDQVERLRGVPIHVDLVRPATVGDGIVRIDSASTGELQALHDGAVEESRWLKFVPASGAASRMFSGLHPFWNGARTGQSWGQILDAAAQGDGPASTLQTFVQELPRFAFYESLRNSVPIANGNGDHAGLLAGLLSPEGLDYDRLPKGLLLFHDYPDGPRTAFEEHLVEAAHYVKDCRDICRLHFTVSDEHRSLFGRRLAAIRETFSRRFEAMFVVETSLQDRSTDTLCVGPSLAPLRDAAGGLRFRPGGHGSLIRNIDKLGADLVFVKNIDNVQPDGARGATVEWKRTLGGFLVQLQQRVFDLASRLEAAEVSEQLLAHAESFLTETLQVELGTIGGGDRRNRILNQLDRPLRVCGVVPNTGEPGGGPFWVRDVDGSIRLQIVESAQVDAGDASQCAILGSSTHFNPVDLVCGLRDRLGQPYDLGRFVDPDTAIVTSKAVDGVAARVLERPGLWNGAMAGWNTVFVEVPLATFSPVKTVLDLLRPEHQPQRA